MNDFTLLFIYLLFLLKDDFKSHRMVIFLGVFLEGKGA